MKHDKNVNNLNKRHKILNGLLCLLAIWMICLIFEPSLSWAVKPVIPTADRYQKEKVFLEKADSLFLDDKHPEFQVLRGNVKFRKEDMFMYCDSANFYDKENRLDAFGNVKMEQGDTLFVFADRLYYNGNQDLAKLRDNVRMEHRETTLFTDSFDYDLLVNVGYYFEGGKIVDESNTIVSTFGEYAPDTKDSKFLFGVELQNEKFALLTDTLFYNTETHIADIVGNTTIVSDSSTVYSNKGWYNTDADIATLYNRSLVVGKNRQTLEGDTIFYNRATGFGEVFGRMVLTDSAKSMTLTGNYGYHNERNNTSFSTGRAMAMEYSQKDTLYLHGDTIKTYLLEDSTRVMSAHPNVRFFRVDVQGLCDSLSFMSRDSMIYMHRHPILWNGERQVTGNIIKIHLNDSTVDKAYLPEYGMVSEHVAEEFYNQLYGKEMTAFFENGDLRQLDVKGNVMTIMLPMEKDSAYNKLVNAEGSFLTVILKNRQMEKLNLWPDVTGKVTPIFLAKKSQFYLKGFKWHDALRPKNRNDIFTIPPEMKEFLETPEAIAPVRRIRNEQE